MISRMRWRSEAVGISGVCFIDLRAQNEVRLYNASRATGRSAELLLIAVFKSYEAIYKLARVAEKKLKQHQATKCLATSNVFDNQGHLI